MSRNGSQPASSKIKSRNLTVEQKKELQFIVDTYPPGSILSKHAKLCLLYSDGYSAKALSKQFSYEPTQIYNLIYRYKKKGVDGILPKVENPKAPLGFTSEQKEQLQYIRSTLSATSKERIKYQAIQLFLCGLSLKDIENALPIYQSSIRKYVKKFSEHDWKGLSSKKSYQTYSKEEIIKLKNQMESLSVTSSMRLRCEIVYLYSRGATVLEIINQLDCSETLIRQSIKLYEQGGQQALLPLAEQRTSHYSLEAIQELERILSNLPESSPKRLRYQIIQLHSTGLSLNDVAKSLECSLSTVTAYVRLFRNHGIRSLLPLKEKRISQYSLEAIQELEHILNNLPESSPKRLRYQIIQLHSKGLSLNDVAKSLECNLSTVSVYVRLFRNHGIQSLNQPRSVLKS